MPVDTIVIGSGVGGLTAALALARAGQRVVVLEQHYLPGGWAHSFTLEGYSFSPGVHYIGELAEGRPVRAMFEGLDLDLAFWELEPEGFDHLLLGGARIDVPRGRARWAERLVERFPAERAAITTYLDVVGDLAEELRHADESFAFPRLLALPWIAPRLLRFGFRTLEQVLDHCGVRDPLLRAALSARCGNHGLPPSEVSFPVHAAMIAHYFEGAFYPRGGARRLTSAYVKALRRAGGELHVKTRVRKILVEGGRAVGVELDDGETILARQVVSNADAATTYAELLPDDAAPRLARRARKAQPSVSCLSLFAAVDADLGAMGYDSGNSWWYRHRDVARIYREMGSRLPQRAIDALFLSVSTLKDPGPLPHGHHTLEMFTFVPYAPFARWSGSGERDAEYRALKHQLVDGILEAAGHVIPGIRERLVFSELGTPLTNVFFCEARQGGCYGTAKTPWQVGPFAFSTASPLEGLHLCGASTLSHGIAGAAMSGLQVAKAILGVASTAELLTGKGRVDVAPAERPKPPPSRRAPEMAASAP